MNIPQFYNSIPEKLLSWYDIHHRHLPWRISPSASKAGLQPNPYFIWLSEIMLQQTGVNTVKDYYLNFIEKWPDIFTLSQAPLEEILKNWAGLGYYSRARNLKICAEQIVHIYNGIFPHSFTELKKLKGIGEYTASALCAIAFGQNIAVIDGNVERIVSRLFAIETPLPKAKPILKAYTQKITPLKRPGDFAQAMMDLGASLCSPKRPKCSLCPLNFACSAYQSNTTERYPLKLARPKRPQKFGKAFLLLSKEEKIYLEKRPETGLLAQMTQIPNYFGEEENFSEQEKQAKEWETYPGDKQQFCGTITHIFTHFALHLEIYKITQLQEEKIKPSPKGYWCLLKDLSEQAFPTLMKKALKKGLIPYKDGL